MMDEDDSSVSTSTVPSVVPYPVNKSNQDDQPRGSKNLSKSKKTSTSTDPRGLTEEKKPAGDIKRRSGDQRKVSEGDPTAAAATAANNKRLSMDRDPKNNYQPPPEGDARRMSGDNRTTNNRHSEDAGRGKRRSGGDTKRFSGDQGRRLSGSAEERRLSYKPAASRDDIKGEELEGKSLQGDHSGLVAFGSGGETEAQRKAAKVLLMLQGGIPKDDDGSLVDPSGKILRKASQIEDESIYERLPDPQSQTKNVPMLLHTNRRTPWEEEENPTDEYLAKKEQERLENVQKSRSPIFNWMFRIFFHLCLVLNFVMACVDRMLISDGKLQALLLKGDFNCLEIASYSYLPSHLVHILQAMMSAMALYADNKENATLCMACVFAQVVHGSYKSFYFFMQMRFDDGDYFFRKLTYFIVELVTDVIVSIVAIQRFYDLTDRIRARSNNFAEVTEGMSMNDEIIYQNQSSFLQRKHILREAIASQTYTVIQKIDHYRKKGLEVDHLELFKELLAAKDALSDVDEVENRNLLKELKKATARRFRQYGTDPNILTDKHITVGQLSKIFVVDFGERDNPLLECKPSILKGEQTGTDAESQSTHEEIRHKIPHPFNQPHHHDKDAKPVKPILHHHHDEQEGKDHPKRHSINSKPAEAAENTKGDATVPLQE